MANTFSNFNKLKYKKCYNLHTKRRFKALVLGAANLPLSRLVMINLTIPDQKEVYPSFFYSSNGQLNQL